MKGTVNPFEPWRPAVNRIPPPLHVGRPWRPAPPPPVRVAIEEPPFVEPIKPLPRNKPPERPKQQRGQTGEPSSGLGLRDIWLVIPLSLGLVTIGLALANVGLMESTQLTRFWALNICALLVGGIVLYHRQGGRARLSWMAVVLALAGIALWFVPTIHGVSLWSAYRQIEELRVLPAGDIAAYQRSAAARRTLVEDFSSFAADVKAAEKAWFRRTADEAIENADRKLAHDPDAALAHLQQLNNELKALSQPEHYDLVRKDLESARRRAVQACLKVAQQP